MHSSWILLVYLGKLSHDWQTRFSMRITLFSRVMVFYLISNPVLALSGWPSCTTYFPLLFIVSCVVLQLFESNKVMHKVTKGWWSKPWISKGNSPNHVIGIYSSIYRSSRENKIATHWRLDCGSRRAGSWFLTQPWVWGQWKTPETSVRGHYWA